MREKLRDKERLQHILEAIENIFEFTQNIDFEKFSSQKLIQHAVIRNFQIIGEAACHLTKDFREQNSQIEWNKIIAFRHILVHDYFNINIETVWYAKEAKLENLKQNILKFL